jgi:hypothetical protein
MKLRLQCTRSLWDAGLKPSAYMAGLIVVTLFFVYGDSY